MESHDPGRRERVRRYDLRDGRHADALALPHDFAHQFADGLPLADALSQPHGLSDAFSESLAERVADGLPDRFAHSLAESQRVADAIAKPLSQRVADGLRERLAHAVSKPLAVGLPDPQPVALAFSDGLSVSDARSDDVPDGESVVQSLRESDAQPHPESVAHRFAHAFSEREPYQLPDRAADVESDARADPFAYALSDRDEFSLAQPVGERRPRVGDLRVNGEAEVEGADSGPGRFRGGIGSAFPAIDSRFARRSS